MLKITKDVEKSLYEEIDRFQKALDGLRVAALTLGFARIAYEKENATTEKKTKRTGGPSPTLTRVVP